MSFNTDLLHAGVVREANGATLPPVCQSSAFEQDTAADLEKIFENKAPGYCYTRVGNPTVTAFENRITKLEGGMASIACASGMAAIMNAILNIVRSGDEIVSSASLYGGSWYEISEKQFSRGYGAILTLRVGSKENAFALIDALKIPYTLSNIGDTKTLVIHPGSTISLHSSEQEKEDAGVFEDLIRVSVGIEDIEDLKADFAQAIEKIGQL